VKTGLKPKAGREDFPFRLFIFAVCLFPLGLEQDRGGDHEKADDDSEDAGRFPLNDPEEEADHDKHLEAVEELLPLLDLRIEDPPLKHSMKTSEIKHSEEPSDQERRPEASEKDDRHQTDQAEDHEAVPLNPAESGV